MPTLTELMAQCQQTKARDRTDDLRLYRELMARRASPDDADLAALAGLQERLGRSDDDVRADIALLDHEARFHRDVEQIQVLTKQSLDAQEKRDAYRKVLDALEREQEQQMSALQIECSHFGQKITRLRAGRPEAELQSLRRGHPDLFGIEPPKAVAPPPKPVVPTRAETRADEVRRRGEDIERRPGYRPLPQQEVRAGRAPG